jgi:hypothetical protein
MDPETREYLEALRHEFAAMRAEMDVRFRVIDSRFDGVDTRFDGVDTRFDAMDRRIEGEHETTRRLFHVVAEDLRHDLQAWRRECSPTPGPSTSCGLTSIAT